MKFPIIPLVALVISFPVCAAANQDIPNLKASIATQLREDGVLGKELNVFTFSCWEGQCDLTRLVFNRCITYEKPEQIIVAGYRQTEDGAIRVRRDGNAIWVEESTIDLGGPTTEALRFEFSTDDLETNYWSRLTGFSGSYTRQSEIVGKVITVEYLPLRGKWVDIETACQIVVPGIPK